MTDHIYTQAEERQRQADAAASAVLVTPVYLEWVGTTPRVTGADGVSPVVVANRQIGDQIVAAVNEADALRELNLELVSALRRFVDTERIGGTNTRSACSYCGMTGPHYCALVDAEAALARVRKEGTE